MSSVERSDLTGRAAIRDAALRLFADRGPDATSVRAIAGAAGVSPALVLHHFGSKEGLRKAIDAYAAAAFEELFDLERREDVVEMMTSADGASMAEAFARAFPEDSPLPAYLRRLLLAGDPAATRIFLQWHRSSQVLLDTLAEMGAARSSEDSATRAAFALVADLALVLLRGPLGEALGYDPMSRAGMERWAREVQVIYRDGMWTDDAAGAARSDDEEGA